MTFLFRELLYNAAGAFISGTTIYTFYSLTPLITSHGRWGLVSSSNNFMSMKKVVATRLFDEGLRYVAQPA